MFDSKVIDWFCLFNTDGIGIKTFWSLLRSYKTAEESLKHVKNPFQKHMAEKILKSMKCNVILADDERFPKRLKHSGYCPPMLFYRGDFSILEKRTIAIIGARNASITGRSIAKDLAQNLSKDFAIISGLANGIDTSAHIGSLEHVEYKSAVSVLPMGFDNIYPKENQKLYEQIAEQGLVITEKPYGSHFDQSAFHSRNRIISLLSEAVIVIEAAIKSGTMSTAKLALDFGCEILVVPGSPLDPRYFGSNVLIKNGATLIQNYQDVLEAIGENNIIQNEIPIFKNKSKTQSSNNFGDKILELLSDVPTSIDDLKMHLGIETRDLLCLISDLEIEGKIKRSSSNSIVLFK